MEYIDTTNSSSGNGDLLLSQSSSQAGFGSPTRKKWSMFGIPGSSLTLMSDESWLSLAYRENNNASPTSVTCTKTIELIGCYSPPSESSYDEEMGTIVETPCDQHYQEAWMYERYAEVSNIQSSMIELNKKIPSKLKVILEEESDNFIQQQLKCLAKKVSGLAVEQAWVQFWVRLQYPREQERVAVVTTVVFLVVVGMLWFGEKGNPSAFCALWGCW